HRAVLEGLLLLWRGDLGAAEAVLLRAAERLPLELPFAGLRIALARRIDLLRHGSAGRVSDAIAAGRAEPRAVDVLRERAIAAFLAGRPDDAATDTRLSADGEEVRAAFALPSIDEVGPAPRRCAAI